MRRKWQEGIEGTDFLVYNWSEIQKKVGKRTHMEHQVQENKMGVLPVNRLLISMALPIIISMLVQAFYNIVDSYFVAKLGESALTAVSLAFPIQTVMIAVGTGTGVGMNAMLSKSLGEKDQATADRAACNGVFLALCSAAVFMLVGVFCIYPFYASQVADYPDIMEYGVEYLTVACLFCQGIYVELVFERILQATGHTVASMVTQLAGAVTNIILDPCFIFGIGPFPRMGVTGAAVATVIGQFVAAIVAVIVNQAFNKEIHVRFKACFRPSRPTIRRIYSVGIPSIIMGSIGSVMYYGHGISSLWRVFQAPVLLLYAGLRHEQRHRSHYRLQLRRPKAGPYAANHPAGRRLLRRHYAAGSGSDEPLPRPAAGHL